MRDLPSGTALLALGRRWLLDELLPLVPPEKHRELRLVATAMAMAEREATAGDAPAKDINTRLAELYALSAPGGGEGASGDLLRRLAADLRGGAFEACEGRGEAARAILWRLTILKLREANPHYLAANGFGE
ncbi:MAG TPA: DUF6285 domain-containing protein [Stellaceae bacterium]|jgi:hypothetical protein|nr:DUF6285 domain-containing protein [Stellaceae bacterium]